ncbi:MAG: MFS transporter [Alphaproteobacteria bacterium]|nr:MFS transporter [Alphaproteobacteria bacterium]
MNSSSKPSSTRPSSGGKGRSRVNYADKRRKSKPASAARRAIVMMMEEVIGRGHPLQDALNASKEWGQLDQRDRRFARRLITILLRHRGDARHVLKRYLSKPLSRRDKKAEAILLLAVVELIWADGDRHAAVDQAVRLMRGEGFSHLTGLANAVLRRVAADIDAILAEPPTPLRNAPGWLVSALEADWGPDAEAVMASLLMPPPLDLRVKTDPAGWAKRLQGVALPHGSVRLTDGMVTALDGYDDGDWWVQDAAASLPAMLLEGAFTDGLKGKTVVDLCELCAAGATVLAVDTSADRLKILTENMTRLKLSPEVITADGMAWSPDQKVDAVLLDAPCSATGTIRRRPDILSHNSPPDLGHLNSLQRGLLEAALSWLKPGGVLVYATCSILKAEGEAMVASLPDGAQDLPVTDAELHGFAATASGRGVRVMPDALQVEADDLDTTRIIPQGNDGFFMARFVKS